MLRSLVGSEMCIRDRIYSMFSIVASFDQVVSQEVQLVVTCRVNKQRRLLAFKRFASRTNKASSAACSGLVKRMMSRANNPKIMGRLWQWVPKIFFSKIVVLKRIDLIYLLHNCRFSSFLTNSPVF